VSASGRGVAGLLRVHVPVTLGERHLTGPFIAFARKFPRVELDVVYDDRTVDLVKERVDVALRVGPLSSPDLVVRKVARLPRVLVATPRYLRERGAPRTPRELRAHDYVRNSAQRSAAPLTLARGDETVTLELKSRLLVNSIVALRQLVLEHQGIAQLSRWLVHRDLQRRALVEVLPGWRVAPAELHVVYPSGTLKTQRVKALVDFLVDALGRLTGLGPVDGQGPG
jgi:DNA-binding transcriptional LysR family regulator